MELLANPIKPYAWGHPEAISRLLGREPNGQPQAELWLGAHPSDASRITSGAGLDQLISNDPSGTLGDDSLKRFGPTLPFLLKVLAAAKPLSLQAHPSRAQAIEGFARENAQGLKPDASTRNYKDPNHKPELICALTPFHALCGFRKVSESIALFRALGLPTDTLETRGLKAYFEEVMTAAAGDQRALSAKAASACVTLTSHPLERRWALQLAEQYPGDIGLIGALLLNVVVLEPGEALYLPAGNLHAYLEGVGIELMASSDNVLRGGLTPKHVDVAELIRVLDFSDGPVRILRPTGTTEAVYSTPAHDFELSRITVSGEATALNRRGPDLLLVTSGVLQVSSPAHTVTVGQGSSVFIGANEGLITLQGSAVAYRATVGR